MKEKLTIADVKPKQDRRNDLRKKVLKLLTAAMKQNRPVSLDDLCDDCKSWPKEILETIETLHDSGYNFVNPTANAAGFELTNLKRANPEKLIQTDQYFGKDGWVRFGFVTDTHLGSKYSRLDVINALYDVFAGEGIQTVYHAGNWIEGEARFNKFELEVTGFNAMLENFLEKYPRRRGITTEIISGDDHEGWYQQREGIDVARTLEDAAEMCGRDDIKSLGYMERDIRFKRPHGSAVVRVVHAGGGSSYAISYTSQKYVESLQGGEKPKIVLVGHYHKFDWSYPREVHVIQGGCTQDQTGFMRKKRLQAMVGGCIVEFKQDDHGVIRRVRVEWMPFYDRKFYQHQLSGGKPTPPINKTAPPRHIPKAGPIPRKK